VARLAKDLFGNPVKQRRPRFEWSLGRTEKATLPVRAARIRWLDSIMPRNHAYGMPPETFYVFSEAKSAFVYGCFVSTTVLCAAFVEHWLGSQLSNRGFSKEAERGLASMIDCCRKNNLLNSAILDRVERLRLIRNPFVHLKSFEHPHTIAQRSVRERRHPFSIMEADAKDSLITMYTVATNKMSARHRVRSGASLNPTVRRRTSE
jgi:hypothetical protein